MSAPAERRLANGATWNSERKWQPSYLRSERSATATTSRKERTQSTNPLAPDALHARFAGLQASGEVHATPTTEYISDSDTDASTVTLTPKSGEPWSARITTYKRRGETPRGEIQVDEQIVFSRTDGPTTTELAVTTFRERVEEGYVRADGGKEDLITPVHTLTVGGENQQFESDGGNLVNQSIVSTAIDILPSATKKALAA